MAGSRGNRNSGETMAFLNMQKGEVPHLKSLADQCTMSDNYHQPVMGGTSPEPLSVLVTSRRNSIRRPLTASSHGREECDVDATRSPRLLPQCEGIENLKTDQSERPRHMSKFSKAFLCRGSIRRMSFYGMAASGGYCCKSLFAAWDLNSPSRRCDD